MNVVAEQASKRRHGRPPKRLVEVAEFGLDLEPSSVGAKSDNVDMEKRKRPLITTDSDADLPPAKRTRGSGGSKSPAREQKAPPKRRQLPIHITAQGKRGRGRPTKNSIPNNESKPSYKAAEKMNIDSNE